MEIIKATGEKTNFEKNKIEKSILKAGASKNLARNVAKKVETQIKKGNSTEKILNTTIKYLDKKPEIAARYDLKRAIMSLGPSGFPFEEFFSQILQNYGYKTQTGKSIKGKMILQEIDIIAEKKLKHMIEAKYHNSRGIHTDTKVAMYTYARFLDVKSNPKEKFTNSWLVTNTRCTSNAIKYAQGVNLKIIGWSYPNKRNLQELIEKKGLYPITIIPEISKKIKEKLFNAKIILAKDLANHKIEELIEKTNLNKKTLEKILEKAKAICSNK
jgi:hypothetical protein